MKIKKMKETILNEESNLNAMRNSLYNPDFLYKILMVLYKCLQKGNDVILAAAGNPEYLVEILSLLRTAPPTHKILIIKIFNILVSSLPSDLYSFVTMSYCDKIEGQKNLEDIFKLLNSGADD
jgi:hypothetical protein